MDAIKLNKIEKILSFPGADDVEANLANRRSDLMRFHTNLQMVFKPMGLLVWGATDETSIREIIVGNSGEVTADWEPIPARFFETGRTFEEITALAEAGELALSLPQRQVLNIMTGYPGVSVRLALTGPFARFCVWGYTANAGEAAAVTEIVELPDGRFEGRTIIDTLDGEKVQGVVRAPGSLECAMMLKVTRRGLY
jgi:hypothetical protein